MANQRKLGRTADQRKALLRNQVTNLIWYGRIETTISKAKEVRRIADRMITLAVRECDNTVSTTKETHNDKGQLITLVTGAQMKASVAAMLKVLFDANPKSIGGAMPDPGSCGRGCEPSSCRPDSSVPAQQRC